jgi:hypothetical protein
VARITLPPFSSLLLSFLPASTKGKPQEESFYNEMSRRRRIDVNEKEDGLGWDMKNNLDVLAKLCSKLQIIIPF